MIIEQNDLIEETNSTKEEVIEEGENQNYPV
jgi:hypothetical protein